MNQDKIMLSGQLFRRGIPSYRIQRRAEVYILKISMKVEKFEVRG